MESNIEEIVSFVVHPHHARTYDHSSLSSVITADTESADYHLILSTLNARFPTNKVAPSGALHPFGDFPLYGMASIGILSPKGTRISLSALVMMAPSLQIEEEKQGLNDYYIYDLFCTCIIIL